MAEKKIRVETVPMIDISGTGTKIRELRKKAKLKESVLAALIGVSGPDVISKWENGSRFPTVDNLVGLSSVFETPIDEIIATKTE